MLAWLNMGERKLQITEGIQQGERDCYLEVKYTSGIYQPNLWVQSNPITIHSCITPKRLSLLWTILGKG